MKIRISRNMGFVEILLAAFFLFNPVWGFSDLLPDLIGYLLMWTGLSRLADLNDSLFESRKDFQSLLWVGVGELLIRSLLKDAAAKQTSEYQQPTWILLFSLALLVLQWWLLIPAFQKLFAGVGRLADKHGSATLSAVSHGRTPSERIARTTTVFVVAHSVLAFLPELAILTSFEYQANNEKFGFDWYEYIGFFRTLGVVVSLIFGLIWLIAFSCYTVRILRDREWMERLSVAYAEDILSQESMLKAKCLGTVLSILSVGVFFTANLRIDGQVALSGVIFAAAMLIVTFYVGDLEKSCRSYRTPCVVLLLVSASNALTRYLYLQRFDLEASKYQTDAFWFFFATQMLEILETVMTLLVIWKMIRFLLSLANAHTEVDYGTPGSEEISRRATDRLHRSFQKRATVAFVFFAIAALGYVFESVLQLTLEWFWLIPFAVSLIAIILLLGFLYELSAQIRWKYLSNDMHNRR